MSNCRELYCEQDAKISADSDAADFANPLTSQLININGLFTMIGESGTQVPVVKAGLVLWHKRRSEVGETV